MSAAVPGRFIAVEGVEGVGKSSNVDFIRGCLEARGFEVVVTREPGGTPLGEDLRALFVDARDDPPTPLTELLMVFAARAQHLERLIRPALARGAWVVSDRFTDASYAYQGAGRELGAEPVEVLEELVQGSFRPDLTLLLRAPADVTRERVAARGAEDRLDAESASFFERVDAAYVARAEADPGRYAVIDAGQPLDAVQAEIQEALAPWLGESADG